MPANRNRLQLTQPRLTIHPRRVGVNQNRRGDSQLSPVPFPTHRLRGRWGPVATTYKKIKKKKKKRLSRTRGAQNACFARQNPNPMPTRAETIVSTARVQRTEALSREPSLRGKSPAKPDRDITQAHYKLSTTATATMITSARRDSFRADDGPRSRGPVCSPTTSKAADGRRSRSTKTHQNGGIPCTFYNPIFADAPTVTAPGVATANALWALPFPSSSQQQLFSSSRSLSTSPSSVIPGFGCVSAAALFGDNAKNNKPTQMFLAGGGAGRSAERTQSILSDS